MKPIIFNTEMVQAILDCRKTVTRRAIKPRPVCHGQSMSTPQHGSIFCLSAEEGRLHCQECGNDPQYSRECVDVAHYWYPPHCPGDILYVRETWRPAEIRRDGGAEYFYYADGFSDASGKPQTGRRKWRPSIHMPKAAARIFLRVTGVGVERLQEITAEQVCDEGVNIRFPQPKPTYISLAYTEMRLKPAAIQQFRELWDSTIKPADLPVYGWEANPWVWVIEFERISREDAFGGYSTSGHAKGGRP